MIVIERTVDISRPIQTETLRGSEFKLEANAHTFRISVTNNGAAVALTGSVSASMLLADGSGLTLGGSLDNGVAVLTLPQAAYGVPGRFMLAIYSVQTGATEAETVKTCIYACVGAVVNTYGEQQYDPGNLIPDAETLAAYIEACQTATSNANTAAENATNAEKYIASPEASTTASKAYAVGDYLIYDGKLYQVTTAIASGGTINTSGGSQNVSEIPGGLSGEVTDLKGAINLMPELKDSDAEDVDLDVSDPEGNVILRLADGHIETKNFDSADIPGIENAVADLQTQTNKAPIVKNSSAIGVDLDVSDNAGNVIVRLQGGHIKVKNFDSSEIAEDIADIREDITEIEETITPVEPTSVTVDSVADLLDEIANGTSDIIIIKNGTYSVLNVEVTRKVEIVGESRTGVFLNCDGTTDQVNPVTDRHGIRFQKGGALKNLTFSVNDVKYVMHQDNIATGYDLLIENCTFNRYDDSCGYYFFIGCGCYGTQNLHVKNCSFVFSENTHDRVSYGVYWHNWHLAKSQLNALAANLTIENCGCVGCGIAIVQDLSSKEVNDVISILNCCSTASAPVSSGANGYYLGVPNADVPYNVLFIINNKIGNMILQDRSADKYDYLGAVVTNFTN